MKKVGWRAVSSREGSMVMDDENDALARGLSRDGEYEAAIAVKLIAGWVLSGEECHVCVTQLICNR